MQTTEASEVTILKQKIHHEAPQIVAGIRAEIGGLSLDTFELGQTIN